VPILAEAPAAAVAAAEAGIEVVLGGAVVRVSPGVDPGLLSAVLRAVRASGGHALAALAAASLGEDPFSDVVLVFRSKRGDKLKLLHWDTSGLVLVWKQLEGGAFRWPPITDGSVRLSAVQFAALFAGLDFSRVENARQIPTPAAAT